MSALGQKQTFAPQKVNASDGVAWWEAWSNQCKSKIWS